ncbi:MAG: nucleotidyltransferase family protein [Marinifilaceae bacterium]|jgi:dTDP-glucose pyrophosphorylase|nr:nucleotidyltransferase family protein [Marinifilaceae bacterium]
MNKDFRNNIIDSNSTIKDALIRLNKMGRNLTLFVLNHDQKLLGTVTDGDIRRALINDIPVTETIENCMNENFTFLVKNEFGIKELKCLKKLDKQIIPILNKDNSIDKIINIKDTYSLLPIDALIMAGGRGVRLSPLTDNTPKPLLEVGGVPIIERNIDRLISYGVDNISLSIKYLGEQLIEKFGDGSEKKIHISYIEENEPLGTMGAISLVDEFQHDDVLVMNSDLLTNIDFEQMYEAHRNSDAIITIASYPYDVSVPYAVLETDNGEVKSFKEKPTYSYYSNAGIYLIKKDALKYVPKNRFYNATDLIEDVIKNHGKVSHFPILGYWLDIGKHEDYSKAQKDIERIKF